MKTFTSVFRTSSLLGFILALGTGISYGADLSWTDRTPEMINGLRAVKFFNGKFIAVGDIGTILTSPDGITWTDRTVGPSYDFDNLAVGDDRVVALGDHISAVSFDGEVWSYRIGRGSTDNSHVGNHEPFFQNRGNTLVAYGNGLFVCADGTISTNGSSWLKRYNTPPVRPGGEVGEYSVVYGGGKFIACRSGEELHTNGMGWSMPVDVVRIYSSTDGLTWILPSTNTLAWGFDSIAYGNNLYVAQDEQYEGGAVFTSRDGTNWTAQSVKNQNLNRVVYQSNYFFVLGGWFGIPNSGLVLTSTDGMNWTNWTPSTDNLYYDVAFGHDTFVLVGISASSGGGFILQSTKPASGQLTPRVVANQGLELKITGEVGRSYQLQAAPQVPTDSWDDLLDLTLTQPSTNVVDRNTDNRPQRFYRLKSK